MVDMVPIGAASAVLSRRFISGLDPIRSQWHTSLTLNELARMSEPRVTTYEQVLATTS